MGLSKSAAKAQALAAQIDTLLTALTVAIGQVEIIATVVHENTDELTARALGTLVVEMDQGIEKAGKAARTAVERLRAVHGAVES